MFEKILVANDGSEGAARAVSAAIGVAVRHGVALHMICVEEMPRFPASIEEVVEDQMDAGHRRKRMHAFGLGGGLDGLGEWRDGAIRAFSPCSGRQERQRKQKSGSAADDVRFHGHAPM